MDKFQFVEGAWEKLSCAEVNHNEYALSLRIWPWHESLHETIQAHLQPAQVLAYALASSADKANATELFLALDATSIERAMKTLQSSLLAAFSQQPLNYALMPLAERNTRPRLMVFDMDSTLIQMECIDEIARQVGCYEQVSEITEAAMRGELDFSQSLRRRVALLNGLAEADFLKLTQQLPLTDGVLSVVEWARQNDCRIAVVSGGFVPFVEHLKQQLGLDFAFANQLEVTAERLTGEVLGEIVDGAKKREILIRLREQLGLSAAQVWAVGDGANDLLMLGEAGLGVAFDAKPKVRAEAFAVIDQADLSELLNLL